MLEEPAVGGLVPRLPGRSQQAQRAEIGGVRPGARLAHQQPYGSRRNAECGHPVPLDHLPEPLRHRIIRRPIVQHNGPTEIVIADNLPRAHHPADVGDPPEAVVRLVVERQVDFLGRLRQGSGVGMHRALRPAGGSGGVEQERGRFGIHRQGGALLRLAGDEVVPPHVAARGPGDFPAPVAPDHHFLDHLLSAAFGQGALGQRLVRFLLQRDAPPAPLERVGGEQYLCARILQPHRHGAIAEAGKDRHGDQAQLETRVQDGDHFGDHGHIQSHPVSRHKIQPA